VLKSEPLQFLFETKCFNISHCRFCFLGKVLRHELLQFLVAA